MQQYLIIGRDGNDEEALQRRMNTRQQHLDGASVLKARGQFVMGGAMLDPAGNMCGSVMVVQFENQEDFEEWYDQEPYIVNGVWKDIEIKPFRMANVI